MVGLATRLTVLNLILMLLLRAGVEQNPGPRTGIRDDQGPITRGNPRQLRLTTEGSQTGATGRMSQGMYWVAVMLGVAVLAQTLAVHSPSYAARVKAQYLRGRRSDLNNAINALPEQEPLETPQGSDPNIGDQLMEEFLTFLTLKETGLLDLCLHMKR
ncbi:uncharacterized protein [Haliotis cracherodii]|uniref:uncharacterized protein n=1 Tax=Haliotis cracherodii TaxID=6455 RepID=UPI0039E93AE1